MHIHMLVLWPLILHSDAVVEDLYHAVESVGSLLLRCHVQPLVHLTLMALSTRRSMRANRPASHSTMALSGWSRSRCSMMAVASGKWRSRSAEKKEGRMMCMLRARAHRGANTRRG